MPETIRYYEVVYVIAPDKTEEQVQAVIDKYTNLITNQGGTIDRTDVWERRRLAYEIKGYTEGIYVVTTFRSLPKAEAELRRVFRISEDTLRSIVIRPDEETVPLEHMARGDMRSSPRSEQAPQPVVLSEEELAARSAPEASASVEAVPAVDEAVLSDEASDEPVGEPEAAI